MAFHVGKYTFRPTDASWIIVSLFPMCVLTYCNWYIYLQEWLIFMVNTGKYTVRPMDPSWVIDIIHLFVKVRSLSSHCFFCHVCKCQFKSFGVRMVRLQRFY